MMVLAIPDVVRPAAETLRCCVGTLASLHELRTVLALPPQGRPAARELGLTNDRSPLRV